MNMLTGEINYTHQIIYQSLCQAILYNTNVRVGDLIKYSIYRIEGSTTIESYKSIRTTT